MIGMNGSGKKEPDPAWLRKKNQRVRDRKGIRLLRAEFNENDPIAITVYMGNKAVKYHSAPPVVGVGFGVLFSQADEFHDEEKLAALAQLFAWELKDAHRALAA